MLEWFNNLTMGPWYADLGVVIVILTVLGAGWRMIVRPIIGAVWIAVKSAPRIPILLEEIQNILESGVLAKLEALAAEQHRVKEQLDLAVPPMTRLTADVASHETRISDHEVRLAHLEGK